MPGALFHPEPLEFWGKVNLLKAGIVFADALTTVSRKYAEEIQTPEYGFGLDGLLRSAGALYRHCQRRRLLRAGTRRPIRHLPARIRPATWRESSICKRELLREMGLPEAAMERPLLGIVSRFASQKGFDLIAEAAPELFQRRCLSGGARERRGRYGEILPRPAACISRTEWRCGSAITTRWRIGLKPGADIFLMPSRYEPCGLNQIYSLRYGTVPVVRATGGLDDTIRRKQPDLSSPITMEGRCWTRSARRAARGRTARHGRP